MAKKLRLGVVYDFRNPPESGMRTQDLYAAVMDQVTWLDALGLDVYDAFPFVGWLRTRLSARDPATGAEVIW